MRPQKICLLGVSVISLLAASALVLWNTEATALGPANAIIDQEAFKSVMLDLTTTDEFAEKSFDQLDVLGDPVSSPVVSTPDSGPWSPIRQVAVASHIPVEEVSIEGPAVGRVDIVYSFTAVITPLDASPPIRYIWSPSPLDGQRRQIVKYVWETPGEKVINLTAYNKNGSANGTHIINITTGTIVPIDRVDISGTTSGILHKTNTFTATVSPSNATQPITYTWSPKPLTGQYSANAVYLWTTLGDVTIMVTATNVANSKADTHRITVKSIPVNDVEIKGPVTGTLNQCSTFTAIVSPTGATWPITYTWSPTPTGGQNSSTATYTWTTQGTIAITVAAENIGGHDIDTHTITIVTGLVPPEAYIVDLPIVLRRWPPIPDVPQLHPIYNSGGGHDYTVNWDSAYLAETYVLEEATTSLDYDEIYSGTAHSYSITGNGPARYYYRVKARNNWGDSGWSNVESVDVLWELEPNTYIYQANGPLVSGVSYYGYPDKTTQENPYPWDCFYFQMHDRGHIYVDLTNDFDEGVQLLLYYESYANLVDRDFEPPPHNGHFRIDYTGAAGQYYTCIYSLGHNTGTLYTLNVTWVHL